MTLYQVRKEIEAILNANCKEYPYEGTEVDKPSITCEVLELMQKLEIKTDD